MEIIVSLRTTELLSNPVKNPASFVGCRSGSGKIIAIRFWFRTEFPFRSHTDLNFCFYHALKNALQAKLLHFTVFRFSCYPMIITSYLIMVVELPEFTI